MLTDMKQRSLFLFAFLAMMLQASSFAQTQKKHWLNPNVNEEHRLPMHTAFFAFDKQEQTDDARQSAHYLSLKGIWPFKWVKDADQRPMDFFKTDFNDKGWDSMPVPGIWEVNGYGDPLYSNQEYAWHNFYKNNPPLVPEMNNHVGSYRKWIEVPASWRGKDIIAHFGSVTSNIYLWVNGKYVGYSEDSKLEAEFNLTPYLKPGAKNLIAFQVFRWSDGTYLECQDFWRLSGVGRDCYLYARNKSRVDDVRVTPDLDATYTNGSLKVELKKKGSVPVELKLLDAEGQLVAQQKVAGQTANIALNNPHKWNDETPYLYTLMVETPYEKIPIKVGFRKIEIKNAQVLINGKPVLFKGANRHEVDPDGGYYVSRERMEEDVRKMKELNLNAVRTCHYPDDSYFYQLCDKYGIYMVSESNLESHGMGYGKESLAHRKDFELAHVQRNVRNVERNYNHPSVIFWSLGNEAGYGKNFDLAYAAVKKIDTSRPVQYERSGMECTDVFCPMYYTPESCEKYLTNNPTKPLIQCEYAHAMGNSEGGFDEYWALIRKYPAYQGGFIWDFVDQSLRSKTNDGREFYAYAGDYNRYDYKADNNFLNNGLISPDRMLNPHAHEAAYVMQSIRPTLKSSEPLVVSVFNEYFFTDLSKFTLKWSISVDGRETVSGTMDMPAIKPQTTEDITIPASVPTVKDAEITLQLAFVLKQQDGILPAGTQRAHEQIVLQAYKPQTLVLENNPLLPKMEINDHYTNYLTAYSPLFRIDIDKATGFISRIVDGKRELLYDTAAIRPNFWRAPTDNDAGAQLQRKWAQWRNPELRLTAFKHSVTKEGLLAVEASYQMSPMDASLKLSYLINNEGKILYTQVLTPTDAKNEKKVTPMFRFGIRLQMPKSYNHVEFYGRGPIENYVDRKYSQHLGLYRQTVDEQFYPYIRPQETGTKSDLRYWRVVNKGGYGLEFRMANPFSASALNRSLEDMDCIDHKTQKHSELLPVAPFTDVMVDAKQMGLGCINSWGALPNAKYLLPFGSYELTMLISPIHAIGYEAK